MADEQGAQAMNGMDAIRARIANDGYALTFQTMRQYREALLGYIDHIESVSKEDVCNRDDVYANTDLSCTTAPRSSLARWRPAENKAVSPEHEAMMERVVKNGR